MSEAYKHIEEVENIIDYIRKKDNEKKEGKKYCRECCRKSVTIEF